MDCTTSTDDVFTETKTFQENILLQLIKEICSENESGSNMSLNLKGKVRRIIADCDLTHYTSLHKISFDKSTSTLLGLLNQANTELSFNEQSELNEAIISKLKIKIPKYISKLQELEHKMNPSTKSRKEQIKELQESLDEKLNTLKEQENEKVEIMMEWLNHKTQDTLKFNEKSSELLMLKTKKLELKSIILHLQTLVSIFTETNQSIKAYGEVHKDLKETIKETENRIKQFNDIIEGDLK